MEPYVELDPDTDRIFLFADWEPGIADKCKSVMGYKWHPDHEKKPWSYPKRMQSCHALRLTWGPRLQIGPNLWAWAREEAEQYKEARKLAKLPDSPLERVREMNPELWLAMSTRTYQRSGAEFLSKIRMAADFDEPGLGKTATYLAAVMQAGLWDGRHLVIAPKTAIFPTWVHEIQKWTDGRAYGMPDNTAKREDVLIDFLGDEEPGARFLIVHPHMIQIKIGKWCKKCEAWERDIENPDHYADDHAFSTRIMKCDWPELFYKHTWDTVAADECQDYMLKLRPSTGKRPESQPQWAHGLRGLIKATKPDGMRIPLTGTPFRGKEANIFGILHWIDPIRYSSFWSWAGACLEVHDESHSKLTGDTHKVVGRLREDAKEWFYNDLDSISLRRTRLEVRSDLPSMELQDHWVELGGEHERQYSEFEERGAAQLESGVIEGLGVLSELTRLRQLAFGPCDVQYLQSKDENGPVRIKLRPVPEKSPKVQLMLDMLRARGVFGEHETPGRKFIIASQFTAFLDEIDAMFGRLGIPTLKITGRVVGKKRTAAADAFRREGGPRLLLMNTTAGGKSLTLDEQCDEMFVLDETWIDDDQKQLLARIDNRGDEIRPRVAHFIRTKDTVEEGIALSNIEQRHMQTNILDRRRGIKVALSLLGEKRA